MGADDGSDARKCEPKVGAQNVFGVSGLYGLGFRVVLKMKLVFMVNGLHVLCFV